jgi:hypothetical protein
MSQQPQDIPFGEDELAHISQVVEYELPRGWHCCISVFPAASGPTQGYVISTASRKETVDILRQIVDYEATLKSPTFRKVP